MLDFFRQFFNNTNQIKVNKENNSFEQKESFINLNQNANIQEEKLIQSDESINENTLVNNTNKTTLLRDLTSRLDMPVIQKNNPISADSNLDKINLNISYNGEAKHFGCTKCGRCCAAPPKVEFSELLKLQNDFIFQTNHTCFLSFNKNPLPQEITDFYTGIGHNVILTDLEAVMFYFIEFTPMVNPSYKKCPKLIDNLCSIYDKRPHSCELYPFSKSYEQDQQWRSINFFEQKVAKKEYECDLSENAPIIYENNMFSDYSLENRFEQSIIDIHNFTNTYLNFLEKIGGKSNRDEHFKYLVNAITQKSLFISDTLNPMLAAVLDNIISEEDAYGFVEAQLKLINLEIKKSMETKLKENLHTTRLYRKQKEIFEKALSTKMFDRARYLKKENIS